jgi:hypothetical protein
MGRYDVTVIITGYDRDRWIEWTISGTVQPPLEHRYGYRLEPDGAGTLVTSYYDWSHIAPQYRGTGIFPVIPEASLRATLGILARITARRDGTPDPSQRAPVVSTRWEPERLASIQPSLVQGRGPAASNCASAATAASTAAPMSAAAPRSRSARPTATSAMTGLSG